MRMIHILAAALALAAPAGAAARDGIAGRWIGEAWLREDRMPIELQLRQSGDSLSAELMLPEMIWRSQVEAAALPDGVEVSLPFGLGPIPLDLSEPGHVLASRPDGLRITLRRAPDRPYSVEEMTVPTPAGPLAATLYLPSDAQNLPGIVLAGGALAESRHHRSVAAWCHHFVRRRIACLVADRRPDGSGPAGTSDLDRDARELALAIRFLRDHDSVDGGRVGLAGFSRGGWAALRAAGEDRSLAFLLLVAAPALSPAATEWRSIRARMEAAGRTADEIAQARRYHDLYFDVAAGRLPWPLLDRAARAVEGTELGEFLDQPLEPVHLDFWRRNAAFDNAADLPRIAAPVLALWGAADLVVPPGTHEPLLRAGLRAAGSVDTLVFANADHSLEVQPGADALGVWRWPSRAPRLVPALDEWLVAHLGASDD